jgi:hypothetical protein
MGSKLANRFGELDPNQVHIPRLLATLNLGLDRRHARRNKCRRGDRWGWDCECNRLIERQRARTRQKGPISADIKRFCELEELLAVGIFTANKHRYLQMDALVSPAFVEGLSKAHAVVSDSIFQGHSVPQF